jgi:hypothetical protein
MNRDAHTDVPISVILPTTKRNRVMVEDAFGNAEVYRGSPDRALVEAICHSYAARGIGVTVVTYGCGPSTVEKFTPRRNR